jgi:hypothetical protein
VHTLAKYRQRSAAAARAQPAAVELKNRLYLCAL